MKFPALALAATIAAGILFGGVAAAHFPHGISLYLAMSAIGLLASFVFLACSWTYPAGATSLLAWFCLGILAAQLQPLAIPSDNVATLASRGSLDLSEPLRWHGAPRSDPLALPWGLRYDLDLQEVRPGDAWRPVSGGLRLEYFFDEKKPGDSGALRAGDRVEVLTRARVPRNFGDPGAFDEKAFLAGQDIYLTATLRDAALLERLDGPSATLSQRLQRFRGTLLRQVDTMLAGSPGSAAVARAMLLGDRSFLDREQADRFRETGVFHVLVLAGLHVGMLAVFLLWIARRVLRLSLTSGILLTLATLSVYVAIVEDRPPILRAALMAAVYLLGLLIFRRLHPLNAVGLAAVLILLFRSAELGDSSFQLSFLAAVSIAGIALPLLERSSERYRLALNHISDVTRDRAHLPKVVQFRLDARAAAEWIAGHLPQRMSHFAAAFVTTPCRVALRFWDLVVLTIVLQIATLPLMALYFHRITPIGIAANLPAVLLTGIVVPLGFLALGTSLLWSGLGHVLGHVLAFVVAVLLAR
jgi:competence protein ComEC